MDPSKSKVQTASRQKRWGTLHIPLAKIYYYPRTKHGHQIFWYPRTERALRAITPVFVLDFLMFLFQDCDSLCGVLLSCYDCSNAWVCYAFIALIKCAPNSSYFMQCLPKVNAALPKPCGEKHTDSETWNSYARSNHNFEQTNCLQSTQLVELCEKAAAGENLQLSHCRIRFTMYFSASKSLSFARILIDFAFPKLMLLYQNLAGRSIRKTKHETATHGPTIILSKQIAYKVHS